MAERTWKWIRNLEINSSFFVYLKSSIFPKIHICAHIISLVPVNWCWSILLFIFLYFIIGVKYFHMLGFIIECLSFLLGQFLVFFLHKIIYSRISCIFIRAFPPLQFSNSNLQNFMMFYIITRKSQEMWVLGGTHALYAVRVSVISSHNVWARHIVKLAQ